MFLGFDPYLLGASLVGGALSLWAQHRVTSTFNRYQQVGVRSGMTGAQAAAAVCASIGATDVRIERHQGFLSDHYDPRSRTLRLSPAVHDGRSVAAIAVGAHEAGHSIQHAQGYALLGFRSGIVPLANIGSRLWMIPFFIGGLLAASSQALGLGLMYAGAGLFGLVLLFQLVTLPVEFDASRRAKLVLAEAGITRTSEETAGVAKVLDAAAMTYLAAAAASLLHLLAILASINRRRN
jgi:Zn-dependent membrane protease YugP